MGLCFRHAVLSAVYRTVINGRLPSSARSPRVPILVEDLTTVRSARIRERHLRQPSFLFM